jgi:ABC-type Fe3+ transport system permease subunit
MCKIHSSPRLLFQNHLVKLLKQSVFLYLLILSSFIFFVDAQKRPPRTTTNKRNSQGSRRGIAKSTGAHYSTGVYLAIGLFLLTVVPTIGVFLYNVWNDPMTPELFQRAFASLQQNLTGFLSKNPPKKSN